jgi:IS30 family transposase
LWRLGGNTIIGKNGKEAILTQTEHKTSFLMAKLAHGKQALPLAKAVVRRLFAYESRYILSSLTMALHSQHMNLSQKN